jgi:hypothetical protein
MAVRVATLLSLALLLASCTSADETVLSEASVYAVFEVVPLSGRVVDGERLGATRIAVLDFVRRKADVLRQLMGGTIHHEMLTAWEAGTERRLTGSYLGFENFIGKGFLRLRADGEKPAEAVVKLVKKCEAKVLYVQQSSYANRSSGVIAVPSKVEHSWAEVPRPSCYAPSDFEHELLSSEESAAREGRRRTNARERTPTFSRSA